MIPQLPQGGLTKDIGQDRDKISKLKSAITFPDSSEA
jgi:hypothetical protein